MSWETNRAPFDANHTAVMVGVSSAYAGGLGGNHPDTVVPLAVNPNNGALLTSPAGTSGTGVGLTSYKLICAASTNATLVSAGAHTLYGIQAFNTSSSTPAYLKLYNKATAPTPGTDTPIKTIPIPTPVTGATSAGVVVPLQDLGNAFSLGLGFAVTGALIDSDTTALANANVVVINLDWL